MSLSQTGGSGTLVGVGIGAAMVYTATGRSHVRQAAATTISFWSEATSWSPTVRRLLLQRSRQMP